MENRKHNGPGTCLAIVVVFLGILFGGSGLMALVGVPWPHSVLIMLSVIALVGLVATAEAGQR